MRPLISECPISHRFRDTADYWSNVRFRQGACLQRSLSRWTLKATLWSLASKNCKHPAIVFRRKYFDILFTVHALTHECDRWTYGQTHFTIANAACASLRCAAKNYRVAPKMAPFLYALTSSNINRFSKLFYGQNQEKICNNRPTLVKDSTTPQVCR